jgi:hypothetical protein
MTLIAVGIPWDAVEFQHTLTKAVTALSASIFWEAAFEIVAASIIFRHLAKSWHEVREALTSSERNNPGYQATRISVSVVFSVTVHLAAAAVLFHAAA